MMMMMINMMTPDRDVHHNPGVLYWPSAAQLVARDLPHLGHALPLIKRAIPYETPHWIC